MSEDDSRTVVTKLLELARVDQSYLEQIEKLRRAVVVMFTDIQGSTAYFEKHGDAAGLLMVHQCNDSIRQTVETHGGRIIKSIGDGMMGIFEDCRGSIEAAIEMQSRLAQINAIRPEIDHVAIRVGLHYGIGIVRKDDVFGDVVNVASRVESVASAGQIVISDALLEKVRGDGFEFNELGKFLLKGKADERALSEVIWDPAKKDARKRANEKRAASKLRLQVICKDGSAGPEYPIPESITIGRSQGDVRFESDPHIAPLNARVFIEDEQLFVEDLSGGAETVFVRIASDYTLQDDDTVMMGHQVLRFRELAGAMMAATQLGATIADITHVLNAPVAEMVRFDENGNRTATYPIRAEEVNFGRTRGTYTFPEDKLMSRLHARIVQRGEDFLLGDLGSRNGTFLKVRGKTPLHVNGAILVGSELLQVAG
jgi:adenylate cyclase